MNRVTVLHWRGRCLSCPNILLILVFTLAPPVTASWLLGYRWSSKKASGSSRNGRKSPGQRLGLKCGDGEDLQKFIQADMSSYTAWISPS